MYKIKKYSYDQAKKLNVTIKPSEHKKKRLMFTKMVHLFVL